MLITMSILSYCFTLEALPNESSKEKTSDEKGYAPLSHSFPDSHEKP
ncbi:hypothetical protein C1A50_3329 [Paenibacillus polymyxa]|nr:hypothetical protein C1A50_3329 [Paenibacillus polymyxa]